MLQYLNSTHRENGIPTALATALKIVYRGKDVILSRTTNLIFFESQQHVIELACVVRFMKDVILHCINLLL